MKEKIKNIFLIIKKNNLSNIIGVIILIIIFVGGILLFVQASLLSHYNPTVFSSNGALAWHQRPQAVYHNDKLYWGWIGKDGDIGIASYNYSDNTLNKNTLIRNFEADDHNTPVVMVRNSDSKIIVAYSKHNAETTIYWQISSNAEDITSFGSQNTFTASDTVTYPSVIQLTGETGDPIYLFYRTNGATNYWRYIKSTDGGLSFSRETKLIQEFDNMSPYTHPVKNGTDRIDFSVNDSKGGNGPSEDIMHMYYQSGSFYKSDGTKICDVSDLPITAKSDLTMIYNSSATDNYDAKNWDIAINSDGYPVITWAKYVDLDTDHRYMRSYWNGSSWNTEEVGKAGNQPYILVILTINLIMEELGLISLIHL